MDNYLHNSNIFRTFEGWIGGSCKPSDKGNPTAFPRFNNLSEKTKDVGYMLRFEDLPEVNSERWLSPEDFEGEIWKPMKGYEERYEISIYGRIRQRERTVVYVNGFVNHYGNKIIKYTVVKQYYQVSIYLGNKRNISKRTHRLVAQTFIPNPDNLPCVNHKDENKLNNCVSNLEWCTVAYNDNYGTRLDKVRKAYRDNGKTRHIALYNYKGEKLEEFEAIADFCVKYGVDQTIALDCVRGKIAAANGYNIRYKEEEYVPRVNKRITNTFHLYKGGCYIGTYLGMGDISSAIGMSIAGIYRAVSCESGYQAQKMIGYDVYVEPFGTNDGFAICDGIKRPVTEEERRKYLKRPM